MKIRKYLKTKGDPENYKFISVVFEINASSIRGI